MIYFKKLFLTFVFVVSYSSIVFAEDKYFNEGLKLFNEEKYEDAKFLFERSIIFNPKASDSYLYLAKIYEVEKDIRIKTARIYTNFLIPTFFYRAK